MLVNVFAERWRVPTHEGTRMIQTDLGILGAEIYDPKEPLRRWFVESLFAPVPGRALGGIRAKLVDEKGFVSFLNQRDLEVSIGMATPGKWCIWAGHAYVDAEHEDWFGVCADEEDLLDDLQEREFLLRAGSLQGVLYPPLEITRRVHTEARNDFEEDHVLLWDMDPETGLGPDLRLETIKSRWARSDKRRIYWDRI